MSINTSGSNYMSNASIMEWMEAKTDGIYGKMRTAMDQSNNRVAAEDALNDIKAKIDDLEASGADASQLRQQIDDTIAKYSAEFPEVGGVLQPIAEELSKRFEATHYKTLSASTASNPRPGSMPDEPVPSGGRAGGGPAGPGGANDENVQMKTQTEDPKKVELPTVKVSSEDAERWTKEIGNKVDTLSKQDQLGLTYIQ